MKDTKDQKFFKIQEKIFDALPSHGGETPSEGLTKSSCGIETW